MSGGGFHVHGPHDHELEHATEGDMGVATAVSTEATAAA